MPEPIENKPFELTSDMLSSGSYLDSVLGAKQGDPASAAPDPDSTETPATPESKDKPVTPPSEAPAAKPASDAPPVEEDPLLATETPAATEVKDPLEEVALPPHARPNTAEAFNKVKEVARTEIASRDTRIKEQEAKLAELQSKASAGPDPALLKELEELRNFKEGLAVQADPKFEAKFIKPLETIDEQIYGVLKSDNATDKDIADIKRLGGIDGIEIEEVLAQLKPGTRRRVEALLVSRESVKIARDEATKGGQEKLQAFLKESKEQAQAETQKRAALVTQTYREYVGKIPLLKPREAKADATPEQKAAVEAANAKIQEAIHTTEQLAQADDPATRAEVAAVAALSLVLRHEKAGLQHLLKSARDENAKLTKQLATLKGASRPGGSREVLTDTKPPAPAEVPFGANAQSAFEALERSKAAQ